MFASEKAKRVLIGCAANLYFDQNNENNFVLRFLVKVVNETCRRTKNFDATPQQICLKVFESTLNEDAQFLESAFFHCFSKVREELFHSVFDTGAALGNTPPTGAFSDSMLVSFIEEACDDLGLTRPKLEQNEDRPETNVCVPRSSWTDTSLSSDVWLGFSNSASANISAGMTFYDDERTVADISILGLMGLGGFYVCPRNTVAEPDDLRTIVFSTLEIAKAFSSQPPIKHSRSG